MSPPTHRVSTAHLQAAYPFVSGGGLGGQGVFIGRELYGAAFCYDPFVLYAKGVITSPNMIVIGQVGVGKSSLIKTYLWRQLVFGRRSWIVDVKGEYGPLAAACGVTPIRLGPGSPIRLNPLDAGTPHPGVSGDDAEVILRRRVRLLASLVGASLARGLTPEETSACELAVRAATETSLQPTLPQVADALLRPTADAAASIATTVEDLRHTSRQVALELRRLCYGDLAGMFDGPTSPALDLNGPMVVLDLSALADSDAIALVMVCATAWLQAALAAADSGQRLVVLDEAWRVLADVRIGRWLQSAWKLSRALGVANIAVMHRFSDLAAAGAAGSEQTRLAEGLLSDTQTRVIYRQEGDEINRSRAQLGLGHAEAAAVRTLGKGEALWQVGGHSFQVRHLLSATEAAMIDTDARMASV